MGNGRRYYEGKKLNIKKVIAAILILATIVMAIVTIVKWIGKASQTQERQVTTVYNAVYTNEKWGVINSYGEYVIEPTYEGMIIIPDSSKAVFCMPRKYQL